MRSRVVPRPSDALDAPGGDDHDAPSAATRADGRAARDALAAFGGRVPYLAEAPSAALDGARDGAARVLRAVLVGDGGARGGRRRAVGIRAARPRARDRARRAAAAHLQRAVVGRAPGRAHGAPRRRRPGQRAARAARRQDALALPAVVRARHGAERALRARGRRVLVGRRLRARRAARRARARAARRRAAARARRAHPRRLVPAAEASTSTVAFSARVYDARDALALAPVFVRAALQAHGRVRFSIRPTRTPTRSPRARPMRARRVARALARARGGAAADDADDDDALPQLTARGCFRREAAEIRSKSVARGARASACVGCDLSGVWRPWSRDAADDAADANAAGERYRRRRRRHRRRRRRRRRRRHRRRRHRRRRPPAHATPPGRPPDAATADAASATADADSDANATSATDAPPPPLASHAARRGRAARDARARARGTCATARRRGRSVGSPFRSIKTRRATSTSPSSSRGTRRSRSALEPSGGAHSDDAYHVTRGVSALEPDVVQLLDAANASVVTRLVYVGGHASRPPRTSTSSTRRSPPRLLGSRCCGGDGGGARVLVLRAHGGRPRALLALDDAAARGGAPAARVARVTWAREDEALVAILAQRRGALYGALPDRGAARGPGACACSPLADVDARARRARWRCRLSSSTVGRARARAAAARRAARGRRLRRRRRRRRAQRRARADAPPRARARALAPRASS